MGTGIVKGLKTAGKIAAGVAGVDLPGVEPACPRSSGWETTIGGIVVVLSGVYLISTGEKETGIAIVTTGVVLMRSKSSDSLLGDLIPQLFGRRK